MCPLLNYCVKLPTDSLSRAPVRDLVVQDALTLIRHDAEIYRYHVGFPEYAMLTIRKLRVFAKGSKVLGGAILRAQSLPSSRPSAPMLRRAERV